MDIANEKQGNRLQYWGLKFLVAVLLICIGYKSPTMWLSISATIWVGYIISRIMSPLLIAASQNTSFAKTAKLTLSVLGNIATAAVILAPIVILHWYRIT
jgi:hypothetical protein